MRLMQANIRTVWVRDPDETADESLYSYQPDGIEIYADIQPTGYSDSRSQEKSRLWGEMPERALVMYNAGFHRLKVGQGVCYDVESDALCDYRITGVENWQGHQRVYLAFIPENRRG